MRFSILIGTGVIGGFLLMSPVGAAQTVAHIDSLTYEAIIATASSRAEDALRVQQNWYWGIATTLGAIVFGLIAFFGFGQIRALRESLAEDVIRKLSTSHDFKDDIATQIESSVLSSLRDAQASIERQIDFLNVRNLAEKLEAKDAIGSAERDAIFNALLRLKDEKKITAEPEFQIALRQVFSSFFQANIWDKISVLEQDLRSIAVNDPEIVQSALPMFGYRVLSEDDNSKETVDNLLRYIGAAKTLNYRESAYPYELAYLYFFKPEGWERRIAIIFEDAETLTDSEKEIFSKILSRLSDPAGIAKITTPYHARIAEKFRHVREHYADAIARLAPPVQPIATIDEAE